MRVDEPSEEEIVRRIKEVGRSTQARIRSQDEWIYRARSFPILLLI